MINANELRLDNWVNNQERGYCQVNGIQVHSSGDTFFWVVKDGMEFQHRVNVKELYPIPLNTEILEKCGFGLREPHITYVWKFAATGDVHTTECKYLHQLQNLHFALTGQELEYKHEMVSYDHGRPDKKP